MRNKEVIDAEKVLELESLCIDLAKKQLNQNFVDALDILHAPKNKIIICGIGKSGHLGKKWLLHLVVQVHLLVFYMPQKPFMEI